MKGLLLKDYYLIGSVLWILLAAMAVIGIAMAVLTSAWALVVIATVMLGMVSVSTINMDKASGWYKVSRVMPVARQAVVDSKTASTCSTSSSVGWGCCWAWSWGWWPP